MTHSDERLGEWLDRDQATIEQELAQRVRAALPPGWREIPMAQAPELFVTSASAELASLLQHGCETRAAAAGLLTVDALVTYACETLALRGRNMSAGATAMVDALASLLPKPDAAA